ncbi:MAG: hypothetical protein QOH68_2937 [Nocardioidaceae bacterium]|jgi:hypothetical protein|nr:hypothetical protein [Nocardioidaceae bacterium]
MHSDYTAHHIHQVREAELVRRLEERRQALERTPAASRRRWGLRLLGRAQAVHPS